MSDFLLYFKQTDNKFRWDVKIDEAVFELYIPKWRVPDPIPEAIKVKLYFPPELPEQLNVLTPEIARLYPQLCNSPITTLIKYYRDHTKTIRYNPDGDPNSWEVGSPYIPISILPKDHKENIFIKVEWIKEN